MIPSKLLISKFIDYQGVKMNDESIFEGSDALKEFKEEWLNVDTKGVLNETIENSAYIYKLLKVQEAEDRLEYLRYLKNQLDNGEISLDEYKEALKILINK